MGYLAISTNVRRYQTHHRCHIFFFQEDSALVHMHVPATQSNCCGSLEFLSLKPCPPQQPELNALTTRFRKSYSSMSMSRESKTLKKSSKCLNSGNALIQHSSKKCNFCISPFYQVVQKHKLFDVA